MKYYSVLLLLLLLAFLTTSVNAEQIIARNSPPIVEQQGEGLSCTTWNTDPITGITYWDGGSLETCVTNVGPCVWDPDDYLRVGGKNISACLFADGTAHNWVVAAWDLARRPKPFDVVLTMNNDVFTMHVEDGYGLMCVIGPDYDQQYPNFELIPLQGGGGLRQGYAIPTDITATIIGKSRKLTLSLEAHLNSTVYCPRDTPLINVGTDPRYQWAKSD